MLLSFSHIFLSFFCKYYIVFENWKKCVRLTSYNYYGTSIQIDWRLMRTAYFLLILLYTFNLVSLDASSLAMIGYLTDLFESLAKHVYWPWITVSQGKLCWTSNCARCCLLVLSVSFSFAGFEKCFFHICYSTNYI